MTERNWEKERIALEEEARNCEDRKEESWERSDTDGFLSQWASGMSASLARAKAGICENKGRDTFTGLFEKTESGFRRVKAKMVVTNRGSSWGGNLVWLVHDDDPICRERKWIPVGEKSRVQKKLGLCEMSEVAPAWATIGGSGRGLSGCANAFVETFRTGCKWGTDAEILLVDER